jgi:hypothetical protein
VSEQNWQSGMRAKFTVVKNDDIMNYLSRSDQRHLLSLLEKVEKGRAISGDKIGHRYLIINVDEPYAKEVSEIMKTNGHWG